MKFAVAALVCLAAAVVAHADPEPHKYHHYPYHRYYHHPHHVKPLKGDGVAKHPGGGTSFVAPRVHGLGKRSADPEPAADPEPVADPDPSKSYSYQVVHHGYPHYGYHHGYRYPYYGYRYSHHYGYPYTYHKHHKRSADPEPEAEPNYRYYGHPHYYKGYYHGYPYSYPYYAGYRYLQGIRKGSGMDYDRPCGDGPSPDVSDSPVCSRRFFRHRQGGDHVSKTKLREYLCKIDLSTIKFELCYISYIVTN
nr:uncharacterized histidine-rich protein DDB_G0274557-like [Penaeus vannamei]